jgi:hypothetical protein
MTNQWNTIPTINTTNALMLKSYFLHTIYHNTGMFRSVLIILRKLININNAYIKNTGGLWNTLKFVHKMFADIKFVCSSIKLVHKMALFWLQKHKLDIPLIWTIVKVYKTTTTLSYGPVLHCCTWISYLQTFYAQILMYFISFPCFYIS